MKPVIKAIKRSLTIARVLMSVYYAYMVEYRAELLFWVLSGSLPLILMGVWNQATANGDFGLSSLEITRYFLAVFFARQFSVVWVVWEFERQVVEGKLSPKLLQPLDPVWHHFASHLTERFARFPLVILLLGFFFLVYPDAIWVPDLQHGLLAALVIFLAFAVRFLMQYTLALMAFWTERASALENFWLLFYLFLSGMIAPLELFPPAVRNVVEWLPFPYFVHFPASLLLGWQTNVPRSLGIMLMWGVIFWVLNRWLWRRGLRHYSGMGA
ncbi:MAG: multidrug ABC transporter permease [Cyanothece sp. SIO2G6]|nr:multidrug ABC transporter permease [Cyanothece sp. SIO2G6]